jgi:hypothetical protein
MLVPWTSALRWGWPFPGLAVQVMTSNTLDGVPLPDNIVWIGAINPLSVPDEGASAGAGAAGTRNTGVVDAMEAQVG